MDQDDDQFLSEAPLGINFDEEATKFFDPEAEADFLIEGILRLLLYFDGFPVRSGGGS